MSNAIRKAVNKIHRNTYVLARWTNCLVKKNCYIAAGFTGLATGVYASWYYLSPVSRFSLLDLALNNANSSDPRHVKVVNAETFESKSGCWRTFNTFASLECESEIYMSPSDFMRCSGGYEQSHVGVRNRIAEYERSNMLAKTHKLSSHHYISFTDLGSNGVISFPEYVFLTTLIRHPHNNLEVAFRMFEDVLSESVDITEFTKIIEIFARRATGDPDVNLKDAHTDTTLLRLLFGDSGKNKITFSDFSRFITNLKMDVLHVEFNYYTSGQSLMRPLELSRSLLKHAGVKCADAQKAIARLQASQVPSSSTITFDAFKSLYEFLFLLEEVSCALNMLKIARHSISKNDFQRAARAVTGVSLDPVVLDTIFVLFDTDGDNHLDVKGFVDTIRARRSLTTDESCSRWDAFKRCVGAYLHQSL